MPALSFPKRPTATPVVLITLKRTPERTEAALKYLAPLKRELQILWATDGLDYETAKTLPKDPRAPRALQPGEVGLSMSWWRACAMIVKNDWPAAMVLEDDAIPIRP